MRNSTKILIGIAAIGVITGGAFVFAGDQEGCHFAVGGLREDNFWEILIERIEKEPVGETVKFRCNLERIDKGYRYTDKNCITMDKGEYLIYREGVFNRIKSEKNFLLTYEELTQAQLRFAEIWNYHLFQSCKSDE